jgi:predicted RecA/RadA family phage recombinase
MKATILDGVTNTRTRRYVHNAALEDGDVIVVNGQVLIAINTKAANVENVFAYRCRALFPKKANLALNVEVCYLDEGNSEITNDPTDNTKAGVVVEFAAAAATEVVVMIGENK